jgi:hypothetical protein
MATFLLLIFLATGGVFIALGLPLMRGKVKPNGLYGFRTQATLNDPAIWYPVNRAGGTAILFGGIAVALVAIATFFARFSVEATATINLGAMFASLLIAIVHGLRVQRRLTSERA